MSGKGRPKALQVETSAIKAKNHTLDTLLENAYFTKALKGFKKGWVFDSQETGQFPHYGNDLRSLPTHLQKLLSQKPRRGRSSTLKDESNSAPLTGGRHGNSPHGDGGRVQCGSATNPEERGLKTELTRTEGYHIHTSCVQVAFVDSYTHQATLRTTSFVDDFPVHVWVFIPPSLLDKSLGNQDTPSFSTPVHPTTTGGGGAQNEKVHDPMISFIAHAPQPIRAQLERLQLLFIMRLKDSFTEFKNTLMEFLVLPSANGNKMAKKKEVERETEGRHERDSDGSKGERGEKEMIGYRHPEVLGQRQVQGTSKTRQDQAAVQDTLSIHDKSTTVRGSTPSIFSSGEGEVSATISGCVLVETVEVCIVLPSILKAQGLTSSGRSSAGATSPLSPSTPTVGSVPSIAMTTQRASGDDVISEPIERSNSERPLYEGGVAKFYAEQSQVSMTTSQTSQSSVSTMEEELTLGSQQTGRTSQTGFSVSSGGSASPSPRVSPTPSQTSLTSQSSQLSMSMSGNMSHALSPSITSLPTVIESSGDEMNSSGQLFHRRSTATPPTSLGIAPPVRSYSASHLPPLRERPTHPSNLVNPVSGSGVAWQTASMVQEGRGHIAAAHTTGWESHSGRSSPIVHVTAIGGTQTVLRTQHESEILWSETPHDSDFIMVERPLSDATGKTGMTGHIVPDKPVEQGVPADGSDSAASESEAVINEGPPLGSESATRLQNSPSHSSSSLLSPKKAPLSRRSSRSSLSSRRLKVQTPPKTEPLYNLVIKVGGICALPNIQAKEISVRASVSDVKLEEVEVIGTTENNQSRKTRKNEETESLEVVEPKVKARIVIGDNVKELFPEDASNLDIVLIGKASDLDVSLLLPNALVLKDFFDDEFEAENPVPMHLRIENTRVILMEEAEHGPDHVKSMQIAVDRTDVHRGRKLLEHVDVFLERGSEVIGEMEQLQNSHSTETLHENLDEEANGGERGEDETDRHTNEEEEERLKESQTKLVQSFNYFLKTLESHLSRSGERHLPRDQQVVTILRQIRAKSQEAYSETMTTTTLEKDRENTTTMVGDGNTGKRITSSSKTVELPPSYYDTVSTFVANYHQSKQSPPPSPSPHHHGGSSGFPPVGTHEELMRLRRDNERLRRQEAEYQRENALLLEKKEQMVVQLSDFDMVTEECKSVKENLVAYKQVMEKQHEQMERLLNENTELQRRLAVSASGRL